MGENHYDVLVVGAGVSGLACATTVHTAELTVAVLEARPRVGGRLLSLPADTPGSDTPGGGAALDLGATWFWPHQHLITTEIDRLGIGTFSQATGGDALLETLGVDDTPVTRRLAGNPLGIESGRFTTGAQTIAHALHAQLPHGTVRLGHPVETILATEDHLRVRAGGLELSAGHVVLALPPRLAARSISFAPALPSALETLARATPTWMAAMTKVVARYREAFWRDRGLAGAAVSHIGPLQEIHDTSGPDTRPAALFGFAPGARNGRAEPTLGERAVRQLARLFGPEAVEPVELHVQDWSAEPHTYAPGGSSDQAHDLLGNPLYHRPMMGGRLHWAGTETAEAHAGHIEGALSAAARASTAVLTRCLVDRLRG